MISNEAHYSEYQEELAKQIAQWKEELQKLQAHADEVSKKEGDAMRSQLNTARDLMRKFEVRQDELKEFAESGWENKKIGVERSRYEVNRALNELARQFMDKNT